MKGFKVEMDFFYTDSVSVTFKIMVTSKSMGVLYEYSFQHKSFESGMRVADIMKEWLLKPNVILKLMSKRLSEELGFEIDVSRGLDGFAVDVAERLSTDMIKENIELFKDDWLRPAMEIELKKRGEIQNEKLDFVTSSK